YWSRDSYLGFGSGAHSFWNPDGVGERWENADEQLPYREALQGGVLPERHRERLTPEQAVAESFFLGLRVLAGLDLAPLEACFGPALLARPLEQAARLEATGALIREGSRVRLAPGAVILANTVFSRFL